MTMSERDCRRIVELRSRGVCEVRIPGMCAGQALSKHHRHKRSHGGLWVPSNVLDVCGHGTLGCHGWVEANPASAMELKLWLVSSEPALETAAFVYHQGVPGWWALDDAGGAALQVLTRPRS